MQDLTPEEQRVLIEALELEEASDPGSTSEEDIIYIKEGRGIDIECGLWYKSMLVNLSDEYGMDLVVASHTPIHRAHIRHTRSVIDDLFNKIDEAMETEAEECDFND